MDQQELVIAACALVFLSACLSARIAWNCVRPYGWRRWPWLVLLTLLLFFPGTLWLFALAGGLVLACHVYMFTGSFPSTVSFT